MKAERSFTDVLKGIDNGLALLMWKMCARFDYWASYFSVTFGTKVPFAVLLLNYPERVTANIAAKHVVCSHLSECAFAERKFKESGL